MRKAKIITLVLLFFTLNSGAQLSKVLKKITNKTVPLSNADIVGGLKEALLVATDSSVTHLSAVDGYLKDLTIKILLPPKREQLPITCRSFPEAQNWLMM